MDIKNTGFTSIEQVTGQYFNQNTSQTKKTDQSISFENILQQKVDENSSVLKFSKHASQRLSDRNINLTNEQMDRLNKGAKLSEEKGISESLVLMDDYAFIVNTKNNTVITAMEQDQAGENVYTNIDGAVLV